MDSFKLCLVLRPRKKFVDWAAEIFVERYRTSHHNSILVGTTNKSLARNAENESGVIFLKRCEKNEEKEGEGGRKKKGGGKGGRKKEGGKSLLLQGLCILSTYIVLF